MQLSSYQLGALSDEEFQRAITGQAIKPGVAEVLRPAGARGAFEGQKSALPIVLAIGLGAALLFGMKRK